MGKRLPKAELLLEIRQERSRLDALLEQLTSRQKSQAGVTQAGWPVKDILGHLIGWQQLNLEWYAAGLHGVFAVENIPKNSQKSCVRFFRLVRLPMQQQALSM